MQRECLMIREKTLPDEWMLFNTKSMLGGALAGQKKFPEAGPLLLEGNDREEKIPPAAKTRLSEAFERLVQIYGPGAPAGKTRPGRQMAEEGNDSKGENP